MKKILIALTVTIILGIVGWFSYQNYLEQQQELLYKQKINSIDILFENLGLQGITIEESTMVVYFNSECEHCQWEIEKLSSNLDLFVNTQLIFVSSEPESQAIDYLSKYNLEFAYVNTNSENIINTFTGGVPQIFIYENEQLKKHFVGESEAVLIVEFLK